MKRDECELARAAYKFIDIYLDMGCFKNPELVRPALLEGFTFGYREAEKYIEDFYKPKNFSGVEQVYRIISEWSALHSMKYESAKEAHLDLAKQIQIYIENLHNVYIKFGSESTPEECLNCNLLCPTGCPLDIVDDKGIQDDAFNRW